MPPRKRQKFQFNKKKILSKKERSDLKEFGDINPLSDRSSRHEKVEVVNEEGLKLRDVAEPETSSDSEEESSAFEQLKQDLRVKDWQEQEMSDDDDDDDDDGEEKETEEEKQGNEESKEEERCSDDETETAEKRLKSDEVEDGEENILTDHFTEHFSAPDKSEGGRQTQIDLQNVNSTDFISTLSEVMSKYEDLYCPARQESEKIREAYCRHLVRHVVRSRKTVKKNTLALKEKKCLDEYRDQGFTRPKVLVVVPFRESARRVVNFIIKFVCTDAKPNVMNKKRFYKEFESKDVKSSSKPADYQEVFAGNTDDHFRISMSVSKTTLKLYTPFFSSDIIVASPLGLRTAMETSDAGSDVLSSIEVCILDQAEVLVMQNWSHVLHMMSHLNLLPKETHGCDFSRVWLWGVDGKYKFYRQTILLSSLVTPEVNALVSKHFSSWSGRTIIRPQPPAGCIRLVNSKVTQTFHRIQAKSLVDLPDARFEYFENQIYPTLREGQQEGTMVFLQSYLDFVRVRNFLKKNSINFVQMSDYSKEKSIDRARGLFYHRKVPLLLYTERLHFYRRFSVRGIRHVIFYSLPVFPRFYPELINFMQDEAQDSSVTVLYSPLESLALTQVLGAGPAASLIKGDSTVHTYVTG